MPDSNPNPNNGATSQSEERPSLRDAAEAAWDEVVENAPDDGSDDDGLSVDDSGRTRDKLGRWASKDAEPGEAEAEKPPSPDDESTAPPEPPTDPAAQASSNQPPQHWSAQDRETFSQLPPPGQEFLLRRHTEMERDYQSRVQAAHGAVQFASALAPVFSDPTIAGSLQQAGIAPLDAIGQWAGFHRRAMDRDPQVRMQLLGELADRMGLVNPAANGQSPPPALTEKDLADPAIRYFADTIGRALDETQRLRQEFERVQGQAAQERQAESLRVTQWGVNSFADEKGPDGKPLRPDFDECLPALIEMYRVNPQLDIRQAYDEARWRTPTIRARLVAQQAHQQDQRQGHERARQAARSNVRGTTSRVSSSAANGEAPRGLRATLEATADEVGF